MTYTQPVITSDVGSFSPLLRMSASATISSRNIIHELLGGGVAVTFGGDSKATSTLEMLFTSEADSLDAYTQLNTGHIFELTDYSKTSTSTYFVISGAITRTYVPDTDDTWTISADIQEVTP
jgi:hypothetical protein